MSSEASLLTCLSSIKVSDILFWHTPINVTFSRYPESNTVGNELIIHPQKGILLKKNIGVKERSRCKSGSVGSTFCF